MQKMTSGTDGRAMKAAKTEKGRGLRGPFLEAGVPPAVCRAPTTHIVACVPGTDSGEGKLPAPPNDFGA